MFQSKLKGWICDQNLDTCNVVNSSSYTLIIRTRWSREGLYHHIWYDDECFPTELVNSLFKTVFMSYVLTFLQKQK